MRPALIASLIALIVSACTQGSDPNLDPASRSSAETLLLQTASGPIAVRVPAGDVVLSRAGALPSHDGAQVFTISRDGASIILETVESVTGATTSTVRIDGRLELGVVSASGRATALVEPLPHGWDRGTPVPRASTTIVVADPTGASEARRYELEGNYEPEAFAGNDRQLFLIQHLPAEAPSAYRVTVLDLRRGEVGPVFGPFKSAPERMPGIRLQQVPSPDAGQLYTLYSSAIPGYAPHDPSVADSAVVSFIHVLDLDEGWAHCVGLPKPMWDRPAAAQAMAVSPDGRSAYVVDVGREVVAVMSTSRLETRVEEVELASPGPVRRTSAVTTPDGDTLFVAAAGDGSIITAIDTGSFESRATWRLDGSVSRLGMSLDGSRIYAVTPGAVIVLDPTSGRELGSVAIPATHDPVEDVFALAS
jgi:hypothetical protein